MIFPKYRSNTDQNTVNMSKLSYLFGIFKIIHITNKIWSEQCKSLQNNPAETVTGHTERNGYWSHRKTFHFRFVLLSIPATNCSVVILVALFRVMWMWHKTTHITRLYWNYQLTLLLQNYVFLSRSSSS